MLTAGGGLAAAQGEEQAEDAQLEAGARLEVDFGLEREPLTRTVTITFDTDDPAAIGDLSIELLGDLENEDGTEQFPAAQITPSATVSGSTARLTVVADPTTPEAVGAGSPLR